MADKQPAKKRGRKPLPEADQKIPLTFRLRRSVVKRAQKLGAEEVERRIEK